jgi:hypothetical protein
MVATESSKINSMVAPEQSSRYTSLYIISDIENLLYIGVSSYSRVTMFTGDVKYLIIRLRTFELSHSLYNGLPVSS